MSDTTNDEPIMGGKDYTYATQRREKQEADAIKRGEWLKANNVTMSAKHIKYSAIDKTLWVDPYWKCIGWNVTITKDGREVLTFPYYSGVASLPCCKNFVGFKRTNREQYMVDFECENGISFATYRAIEPDYHAALWSIVMDYVVLDYPTYEQWAPEGGFGPDSRRGEKTYREMQRQALALRAAFGEAKIEELRELLEDF